MNSLPSNESRAADASSCLSKCWEGGGEEENNKCVLSTCQAENVCAYHKTISSQNCNVSYITKRLENVLEFFLLGVFRKVPHVKLGRHSYQLRWQQVKLKRNAPNR